MARLKIPYAFRELYLPARYKAFHGGRGSAKSHSMASALVVKGYDQPLRWLFGREIQKSIKASVHHLLKKKIKEAGYGPRSEGGDGYYKITDRSITGGDGRTEFLFEGLRTNPDSIKSMEDLDGAWIEEANRASQNSLTLLVPTLRKDGSELWASWNRQSVKDPIDNMFLGPGGPPPDSIVRRVNHDDNPFFPQALFDEMMWDKARDRDKWLHVWEGEPIMRSEARVFHNWRVEDIDEMIPEGCIPRLGADWGFAVDPTVLIECYVFDRIIYFRREAFKVKCAIDETPALFAGSDTRNPQRWQNGFSHPGLQSVRDGHRIVADSARPETIKYMADRGFNITRARKGPGSVEEGVEFMKSYDIVVHPDCVHVETELTHYAYKEDPITEDVLPILKDRDNHTIDAARYALEGERKADQGSDIATEPGECVVYDDDD